jgi:hypothetical protein
VWEKKRKRRGKESSPKPLGPALSPAATSFLPPPSIPRGPARPSSQPSSPPSSPLFFLHYQPGPPCRRPFFPFEPRSLPPFSLWQRGPARQRLLPPFFFLPVPDALLCFSSPPVRPSVTGCGPLRRTPGPLSPAPHPAEPHACLVPTPGLF